MHFSFWLFQGLEPSFNCMKSFTAHYTFRTWRRFEPVSAQEISFFSRPYTRTFIGLILHSTYEVRKQAYDIIRRLVNNLRSSETDISLAIINGLSSYLNHFHPSVSEKNEVIVSSFISFFTQNEATGGDESSASSKLTIISKGVEETLLCLAKAMRMQDTSTKVLLCARALLVCCASRNLLGTDGKLWLKFLYQIFDKQQNEIEDYFQANVDALVQICTSEARLQKVNRSLLISATHWFATSFSGSHHSDQSALFDQGQSLLETISPNRVPTLGVGSILSGDETRVRHYEDATRSAVRQERDGNVKNSLWWVREIAEYFFC